MDVGDPKVAGREPTDLPYQPHNPGQIPECATSLATRASVRLI